VQNPPATPNPTPTRKAAISDADLLTRAKQLADFLGANKGDEVRAQFTQDYLKESASLTQWGSKKNMEQRGPIVEVGAPTAMRAFDSERRQVRVPMKFTNQNLAAIFTFTPEGMVARLDMKPIRGKGGE